MNNDLKTEGAPPPANRILAIGSSRFTEIEVMDQPGEGGACHVYHIQPVREGPGGTPFSLYGQINFQNGPIGENGVNGCHQEDLIAIVIDRLEHFQAGPFYCRENALALTKLEEAMHWLNHRTAGRQKRGVEGTSQL